MLPLQQAYEVKQSIIEYLKATFDFKEKAISKAFYDFNESSNNNYFEEVRGSEECTMGTAIFDETNYVWQLVYIKQYPDKESYSGHYMRIL